MAAVSSENQDPQVIKALLAAGADVNAKDGNGDSVLDWARKVGSPATIRMLEAAGAKGREPGEPPKPAARPADIADCRPARDGPAAEIEHRVLQ